LISNITCRLDPFLIKIISTRILIFIKYRTIRVLIPTVPIVRSQNKIHQTKVNRRTTSRIGRPRSSTTPRDLTDIPGIHLGIATGRNSIAQFLSGSSYGLTIVIIGIIFTISRKRQNVISSEKILYPTRRSTPYSIIVGSRARSLLTTRLCACGHRHQKSSIDVGSIVVYTTTTGAWTWFQ